VTADGLVVGINTAIASHHGSNSGVAFSIPINLVKRIGKELLEKGAVSRGYLGVQLAPVIDPNEALKLGLERVRGALVESVHPNSPAATAGLAQGDVILKLESVELRDENHLINLISYLPANQRVRLGVWRARKWHSVDVVVGDWSAIQSRGR
jgi:serine protease Do